MFLLTSSASYSEVWAPAAKASDGTIISYDSSSVKRFGDIVMYWEMSSYSKSVGQDKSILSKKTQIELNCKTGFDRATKILAYSKPNAGGDIVDAFINNNASWSPSLNDSAGAVMQNTICSLGI
jgi:hypothetical protein